MWCVVVVCTNSTLHTWSDVGPELGLGLQRVQIGHNMAQGASICVVL